MLSSPEAIRYVLVTQAHLFKPTYPKSKEKLIGPSALFFHHGDYHTKMRKLFQPSFSQNVIRNLIPQIEAIATSALDSISGGKVVNTFYEMKKFTFEVAVLSIFGHLDTSYKEMLKKNYNVLDKGYNSFSIKLPGFSYTKSVMARRRLGKILCEIIEEKRENRVDEKDLLGRLINFKDHENGQLLTDDLIADNVIGVLFAAQDTTASLLTWILKYLHDDSKLLQAVKEEQKAIFEANVGGELGLTRAQTRNMPLTDRVGQKPNTFMPFGNGVHACPGNEVAKLEILILIHHLVNKYRWEVVESRNGVQCNPYPIPWRGLPAKFWKAP
ncbi:hypothetical protein LWI29_021244 [Acer saccharum]|uniref:Uncharacterized protein n=1 Tax=Acer saccharum TaxID=4024 RepID=A0AA39TDA3_ACESA|nr:hypothetical protein LWI29_021244 [Acer saccharum]